MTSSSTRFEINDLIMFCHTGLSDCMYGVIVEISDKNPYTYTYKIKWLAGGDKQLEELDGVWLDVL